MMIWKKVLALFVSRRFTAALAAVLLLFLQDVLGVDVDSETLELIVVTIVGWIVGDSLRETT